MRVIDKWLAKMEQRQPSFIIGSADNPYLLRWYLIPRNRFFNIYLHKFLRSDDDRALHDHPWWSVSFLLKGQYWEWTAATNGLRRELFKAFAVIFRSANHAHRVELVDNQPAWTLFVTGPKTREWGFHCQKGWIPWTEFVAVGKPGETGPGCGEE